MLAGVDDELQAEQASLGCTGIAQLQLCCRFRRAPIYPQQSTLLRVVYGAISYMAP